MTDGRDDGVAGLDDAAAGQAPPVAVILTAIPRARILVALCAFTRARATVLETSAGPLAVLDDGSPEGAHAAAAALSAFLRKAEFLLVANEAGTVRVEAWRAGAVERTLAPGLALANAPGVVTSLVTGAQTIDQVAETHADKVHRADMGRFAAYRELLRETRALRKAQA